jgi:uncharacterized surface protein with fasciclin (FAS1) repeats
MKSVGNFLKLSLVCGLFLLVASCKKDDDNDPPAPQSLYELAEADANLSTFVTAVDKTQLTDMLNTVVILGEPYTVFAPNNAAFDAFFAESTEYNSLGDFDTPAEIELLRQVLLNHILEGEFTTSSFADEDAGYVNTMAEVEINVTTTRNLSMYFATPGSDLVLNGLSEVTQANREATNGIMHVVDNIILPPSVGTFLAADTNLSTFLSGLSRVSSELGFDYLSPLYDLEGIKYTLFPPSNQAFQTFFPVGQSVTTVDASALRDILEGHMDDDSNHSFANLVLFASNGTKVNTISGQAISLEVDGTGQVVTLSVPVGMGTAIGTIIGKDIQAVNGAIHILDGVLGELQ